MGYNRLTILGHTFLSNRTSNNTLYETLSNAFVASRSNKYTGLQPFSV